ncbi:MAG: DNA gyrase C-terminal beta-propeller domain-containing protein, partial [Longimicrobiales bacterium]
REGDEVVGMVVAREDSTVLVVAENGLGKRTPISEYRLQKRGGYGVINLKVSDKTGEVVTVRAVSEDEQLMFITRNGVVNRQRVSEIRVIGRATQGVRLVNLDEGDVVMDVARVVIDDENGDDVEGTDAPAGEEPAMASADESGGVDEAEGTDDDDGPGDDES